MNDRYGKYNLAQIKRKYIQFLYNQRVQDIFVRLFGLKPLEKTFSKNIRIS